MEQLLQGFEVPKQQRVIQRLTDQARSSGMTVFLGTSGASFRLTVPGRTAPLSLGWIFRPGTVGWLGLKDLNLGYEPGSSLPIADKFIPPLKEYAKVIEGIAGGEKVAAKGLRACRFTPSSMVDVADDLLRALKDVVEKLTAVNDEQ